MMAGGVCSEPLFTGDAVGCCLGVDLVVDQRRTNVSRADGIHRDAVRTTFKGCGFGQTHHAVLGRYVGRFELAGAQAMHRVDVDDPPSLRSISSEARPMPLAAPVTTATFCDIRSSPSLKNQLVFKSSATWKRHPVAL
jgi:hypothetical protein